MFHRILAALEDTVEARTAFDYALKLARRERAELHVVSVGPIPEMTATTIDEVRDARRQAEERFAPLLRSARALAESTGQPITTSLRFGHVADVVIDYAIEHRTDLIVVGKQHHHLGSVAERIIREAPCPVFIAGESEVVKYTGPVDHRTESWEVRKDTRETLEGHAKMLRVYIGEDDRWEDSPLYEAIVRRLRSMDSAGASVFRGIMGYGAQQRVHKTGFLGLSGDLPILITVVDTEENITRASEVLEEMVDEGLIVISDAEVIKYSHTHHEVELPSTPRRRSTDR
jgi:PII-like signaling protein/nucleotide-binding universal stress UspA family protein